MARNILTGLLAVFIVCAIAGAGYRFGRHLAQKPDAPQSAPPKA